MKHDSRYFAGINRAAILTCAAFLLLFQLKMIDDSDVFFQAKLGQLIIASGYLLDHEPYSYITSFSESIHIGWLAQILLAFSYNLGSWPAVRLLFSFILVVAFYVSSARITNNYWRSSISTSLFSVSAAISIAFLASLSNSSIRPQIVAFLCFAVLLRQLEQNQNFFSYLAFIPVGLLWQNSHPSLSLGMATCALYFGGNFLAFLFKEQNFSHCLHSLSLGSLCFLLQFVTPTGLDILRTTSSNVELSRNFLQISEWMPPWHPFVISAMITYWVALAFTVLALAKNYRTLRSQTLVPFVGFTALALYAARFAPIWAIYMIPLWINLIEQIKPTKLFAWVSISRSNFISLLAFCLCALLAIVCCSQKVISSDIPIAAISKLQTTVPNGNIYIYREWSGPLAFYGSAAWKFNIDGRIYLYSKDQWKSYINEALGQISIAELTARHQPTAFFLHKTYHKDLIELLRHEKGWEILWNQDNAVVFTRQIP